MAERDDTARLADYQARLSVAERDLVFANSALLKLKVELAALRADRDRLSKELAEINLALNLGHEATPADRTEAMRECFREGDEWAMEAQKFKADRDRLRAEITATHAALEQLGICRTGSVVSRICELGTKFCAVEHRAAPDHEALIQALERRATAQSCRGGTAPPPEDAILHQKAAAALRGEEPR